MTFKEFMKSALCLRGHTQGSLAALAGQSSRDTVAMAMSRDNPYLDNMLQYTDALQCEVWVLPKGSRPPADGWQITRKEG